MDPVDHWRRIEELFHAALDLDAAGSSRISSASLRSRYTNYGKRLSRCWIPPEKPVDFLPRAVVEVAHKMTAKMAQRSATGVQPAA